MVYIYRTQSSTIDAFTFTFCSAGPALTFSFDRQLPVAIPLRPYKRRRALSDVDGAGNQERKKRRLRLNLITSRLSRPYSQPATNIVNRGASKIAAWAKNRVVGRHDFRKVAIMNRIRLRTNAAKDFMRRQEQRGKETLALRELVVQKPRCHEFVMPPSPLGLSNYDALDLEDEMFDDGDDDGDTEGGLDRAASIYSDFNVMNPMTGDGDDYDYLDALDGITAQDLPDPLPDPPGEAIVEMLRDQERQGDSYFVRVGG